MTIHFTATHEGKDFEIEISKEGELSFPGYDIDYDILMVSMGDEETPEYKLLVLWNEKPSEVICINLGLERSHLARLACDWAEHVLPIFKKIHRGDPRPGNAFKAARSLLAGKIDLEDLLKAVEAARDSAAEASWAETKARSKAKATQESSAWAVVSAVVRASDAVQTPYWPSEEAAEATEEAREAADAAARNAAWATKNKAAVETSWQVRHFVHAMEYVQSGKKWPDIRETP